MSRAALGDGRHRRTRRHRSRRWQRAGPQAGFASPQSAFAAVGAAVISCAPAGLTGAGAIDTDGGGVGGRTTAAATRRLPRSTITIRVLIGTPSAVATNRRRRPPRRAPSARAIPSGSTPGMRPPSDTWSRMVARDCSICVAQARLDDGELCGRCAGVGADRLCDRARVVARAIGLHLLAVAGDPVLRRPRGGGRRSGAELGERGRRCAP